MAYCLKWPLKPAPGEGTSQLLEFFPVSEACWVHLLLDGGAWEAGFIPSLACLLWKSPRKKQNCWCTGSRLYLCLQVEGGFCAKLPTSLQGKSAHTMGT